MGKCKEWWGGWLQCTHQPRVLASDVAVGRGRHARWLSSRRRWKRKQLHHLRRSEVSLAALPPPPPPPLTRSILASPRRLPRNSPFSLAWLKHSISLRRVVPTTKRCYKGRRATGLRGRAKLTREEAAALRRKVGGTA